MNERHAERLHARYSPSSLESRELCPGWENRENETATWADDGEKCHEATEGLIQGDATLHETLTPDLKAFVQEAYDYAAPRIAGAEQIVSEKRLYHAHPLLKENCHGTPDLYAILGTSAQLIDFKFGRRPVTNAQINLQGWAYVLALWDTYPHLEEITVHFVAPRVYKGTTHHTFTRNKDYDRFLVRILRVVERAIKNEEKSYRPSWSSCAYCGRKSNCKKLGASIDIAYNLHTTELSPKSLSEAVGSNDPEDLGFLNNATKIVADWAEQTQEAIKQKALEGNEIKGYELRFSKGRTSLRTLDKVQESGIVIPVDKLLSVATIPLAELKRLYTDGVPTEERSDKERELMTKLAQGGALKSGEEICYLYRTNENQ